MGEDNADPNVLRILLATDNHLGYLENDPVRGNDSFVAFEEILEIALEKKVDFVLLGGDLFHYNKPSRRTIHRTIQIFRKYCLGEGAVRFRVLSDQKINFGSNGGRVNYEDPNFSVQLPIFTIHGNHDDPTRDGGTTALSAVDILSACNLLNYFGKSSRADDVDIAPVLLSKGTTKVAVYGLGNIRDERLNRAWTDKKVKFLTPEDGTNEWFNVFVLHQNRDYGRGPKNCIHERMLPNFLDLVVWGHEHECIISPQWAGVDDDFAIVQPGSSVATSLVKGEEARKHVGILQIRGEQFKVDPYPLKSVRPFILREVCLADELDPMGADLQDTIYNFLTKTVQDMLDAFRKERDEGDDVDGDSTDREDVAHKGESLDTKEAGVATSPKTNAKSAILPLLRLRVDHTGFQRLAIQVQRFGAQFVGRVANPDSILLLRRRIATSTGRGKSSSASGILGLDANASSSSSLSGAAVGELIARVLAEEDRQLTMLKERSMNNALEQFVTKSENQAIEVAVKKELKEVRTHLKRQKTVAQDGRIEQIIAQVARRVESARETADLEREVRTAETKGPERDASDDSNDEDDGATKNSNERKRRRDPSSSTTTRQRRRKVDATLGGSNDENEEEEDASFREQTVQSARTSTRKRRKQDDAARKRETVDMFSDANVSAARPKSEVKRRRRRRGAKLVDAPTSVPTRRRSPRRSAAATKAAIVDLSQDDDDGEDGDGDDFTSAYTHASAMTDQTTTPMKRASRRSRRKR
eukprot:g2162.t1